MGSGAIICYADKHSDWELPKKKRLFRFVIETASQPYVIVSVRLNLERQSKPCRVKEVFENIDVGVECRYRLGTVNIYFGRFIHQDIGQTEVDSDFRGDKVIYTDASLSTKVIGIIPFGRGGPVIFSGS